MKDFNKALKYAFILLKFRQRHSAEILNRLTKKGYSLEVIEDVLDYLKKNKYIDDEEFVKNYISTLSKKGFGRRKILAGLKNMNISEKVLEDLEIPSNDEKILQLIDKKINQYKGKKNVVGKILRYLLSRGFEYDEILNCLNKKGLYNNENI